jgi:histidine ammonia-lyase
VSDNPLFFPEEDLVLCGGALHGESIAMALDFLAIAASELASISERRTYQLLSGRRGLPDFLVAEPGLNSGFMVAQYTAASLVNHNKVLCTPACVDTITTCQLQEDHVSMGGTSAVKLLQVLDNCSIVLGIELLVAAQAVSLAPGLALSAATAPIVRELRRTVAPLGEDRVLADDIAEARRFVDRELPRLTEALA